MTINKEIALKLWDHRYGSDTVFAEDCYGTYMCREDYGIEPGTKTRVRPGGSGKEYFYGWNIDHIKPADKGGTDDPQNLELVHYNHNGPDKSDDTKYTIDGKEYKIVVDPFYENGYGIYSVQDGMRIDWKAHVLNGCEEEQSY
jgi:hypothetical protein